MTFRSIYMFCLLTALSAVSHDLLAQDHPKLYWTDTVSGKLQRANLDGSSVEEIIPLGSCSGLFAIALDTLTQKVYWSDQTCNIIHRADMNGQNSEDLITLNSNATGLDLDLNAGKMYWGEFTGTLIRANLDGSQPDTLSNNFATIEGVALDLTNNKIYWTEFDSRIRRSDLDGGNAETVINGDDPRAIALDTAGGKMYWSDAKNPNERIRRANLDGTSAEDIVTGLGFPIGVALDLELGHLYWLDADTDKLQRSNLDGSSVVDIITTGLSLPIDLSLDLSPRRNSPVPVQLSGFSANFVKDQSEVGLIWRTASETDNFGFEIERLVPALSADWHKIGFVRGHGTVTTARQYHFADNVESLLAKGRNNLRYRLKQIDKDGHFEYSEVLDVTISLLPAGFALHANYPNPFNPETRITYDIANESQVTIAIFNMEGRHVVTLVEAVQAVGQYRVAWRPNAGDVASGTYLYRLRVQPVDGGQAFTQVRQMVFLK